MDLPFSFRRSATDSARPCEDKAGCRDLRIVVNQMNGAQMEAVMPVHRHLADLKELVARHFQIPADCQRFYHGVEPLGMKDSDSLSRLSGMERKVVSLTVVVSTEQLVVQLESPSSGARVAALGNLAQLGTRAKPQVEQVCRLLATDADHRVRRAAANALPHIALAADEEAALDELISRFSEETNASVQQAIATAMAQFTEAGNHQERIFTSAENKLQSENAGCRRMGLTALSLAAPKGNQRVAATARSYLRDADASVRFQALQTLVQVSEKGDESAIDAVCNCLDDQSGFVQSHALAVLPDMLRASDVRECDVRARERINAATEKDTARDDQAAPPVPAGVSCSSFPYSDNAESRNSVTPSPTKTSPREAHMTPEQEVERIMPDEQSCFFGIFSKCFPNSARTFNGCEQR